MVAEPSKSASEPMPAKTHINLARWLSEWASSISKNSSQEEL